MTTLPLDALESAARGATQGDERRLPESELKRLEDVAGDARDFANRLRVGDWCAMDICDNEVSHRIAEVLRELDQTAVALIAEVRELTAENERLRKAVMFSEGSALDSAALRAENERLRECVATLHAALETAICLANKAANEWDAAPNGMRAGKTLLALAGHRKGYLASADSIHEALSLARSLATPPTEGETK